MAQACDKFSKTSLMGNWYEERQAPNQPFRDNLENKTLREVEVGISFPSDNNQLQPLARIKRNQPWDTKGLIPDDGFREFRSEQNTKIDPINLNNYYNIGDQRCLIKTYGQKINYPENSANYIQTYKSNNYKMINEDNIQHIKAERKVPTNVTDFGSTFQRHKETHDKFYGITQYQHTHSRPIQSTAQQVIENYEKNKDKFSGANERPVEKQSIKSISALTGEKFKNEQEPKDNTAIQRSWLPYQDKALNAADNNLKNNQTVNSKSGFTPQDPMQTYKQNNQQTLPYDIATSLPLGSGAHSQHPLYMNPGAHRHIRTEITNIRNKPLTKK
ncbi:hypothetical protein PPERSA_02276 [Pseudocohnilembus persalinus]|uniref:Uncharacterized protein n=1 Tax=Pseudocohnilembus persalinus TaxID=266149 RepID=A0A0V0QKQ0_PSEPJ|nr:hypothetical protein PPERSA_02276 [Pseudocohnilembus persalinus]|eukprot:KRX02786.1 hypothetical protein PPERSA_02276 [Pseudocohnilembus persalinus]